MFQLNNLQGLIKKRKRIGRGGSRGGTSGRGGKGQKARTGHSTMRASFEGGQMPLVRRLPKRGFNNKPFVSAIDIVNLQFLENKFQEGQEITKELLFQHGLISDVRNVVKILGKGSLTKKFIIHAEAASKSAREVIEKNGGKIALT